MHSPTPIHRRPLYLSAFGALLPWAAMLLSCGGVNDGTPRTEEVEIIDTEESVDAMVEIDVAERHQTLEGFGAAVGWYGGFLAYHPNRDEINELLFRDMGADIIRMRNTWGRGEWESESTAMNIIATQAEAFLGRTPHIQMSSWSPPAALKDNELEDCRNLCQFVDEAETEDEPCAEALCTLIKDDSGEFVYDEFADYWFDSLLAWRDVGIEPQWISIQNEPDFLPGSWEGCRFDPDESESYPSYAKALSAVHERLAGLDDAPKLIGPETLGVHNNRVLQYTRGMNLEHVHGIAHHLYAEGASPQSYINPLGEIADTHPSLPVFQTEFSGGDMFDTAWLIHNSMVETSAVAYIYWELIWAYPWMSGEDPSGLISLESPSPENWRTEKGYEVQPDFHAVRHFARHTDPGFVRVAATTDEATLLTSAYLSPDEEQLTVVVLNAGDLDKTVSLTAGEFDGAAVQAFSSDDDAQWQPVEDLDLGSIELSARSVLTVVYAAD